MRHTVGLVIYHERLQRYLILRRNPERYRGWGLIKGGIEQDETPEQACLRETLEEIGVRLLSDALKDLLHQSAYFDNTKNLIVTVKWFYICTSDDMCIKLETEEWAEHRWATYDEALYELAWQSHQHVLRLVHARLFGHRQHLTQEFEN